MNIELNEREAKLLAEFAAKQHEGAKDNIGTATPIHVVERTEKYSCDEAMEGGYAGQRLLNVCGLDSMIDALLSPEKSCRLTTDVEYEA
jgi:hypothetical protein